MPRVVTAGKAAYALGNAVKRAREEGGDSGGGSKSGGGAHTGGGTHAGLHARFT